MIPFNDYVIATEPLSNEQMALIGWEDREALSDSRSLFNYFRLSADNRIVFGGEIVKYYYGSRPSSGNNKYVLSLLEKRLLKISPQLNGIKIAHRWGGTDGLTRDMLPLMGVLGDYKNIFYSVGYSGEGVCWANLAGKMISQLYAKEDTDLTRFFLLNRKPPYIPPEPFREVIERFSNVEISNPQHRQMARDLFANTENCRVDGAGRMMLATQSRRRAGIGSTIVLVGVGKYFEIWARERFDAQGGGEAGEKLIELMRNDGLAI